MSMHIEGRRWFERTNGNTYHSVRIFIEGEIITVPFTYGYGDQYLQTALEELRSQLLIPDDKSYGILYVRETLGASYSVIDVGRKKDL